MNALELRGGVFCTTSGLLTATGAETVHDTTVTINYVIDGKIRTKAAITDGATPTTDVNTGAAFPALIGGGSVANTPGNGCVVVWGLNAAGTVKCAMGRHQKLDMSGNFVIAPEFPTIPDDFASFAYQVLKAGATASASGVTFGSSNWNATGFTNTIVNVAYLPSRPQVS